MDQKLNSLFRMYSGCDASSFEKLPLSGSNREYFRIRGGGSSVIGVLGNDLAENRAFLYMAEHFRSKGIKVPQVYASSEDCSRYIQQDLGSESLYDALSRGRESGYSAGDEALLTKTIGSLPQIQCRGAEDFDFSFCHPVEAFDGMSVMFDLNYFKYCFLKPLGCVFDEVALEKDFCSLRDDLLSFDADAFMYRDFQARNVMLFEGEPYFIDFQGGRRGPVHYDVSSFIFQARSSYPQELREKMLEAYLDALKEFRPVDKDRFRHDLRQFSLFRTLQVLGAYGFRGYFEGKTHFKESVPFAMANLRDLLSTPFGKYPYLEPLLKEISSDEPGLTVTIMSFSYKNGIPEDRSGNGGGYIFDCRALNNPGRYPQYADSTGRDADVVEFLEKDGGVFPFMEQVCALVDSHVRDFLSRGFTHLSVNFGCTGGQHRSVYCAESLSRHLVSEFGNRVRVCLIHREHPEGGVQQ